MKKRFKTLTLKQVVDIETEVKIMLHAHRDTLRNRWIHSPATAFDPRKVSFDCREGFHGEAFGIMRGLVTLGYGYFGSDNLDATQEGRSDNPLHNCKFWFSQLTHTVLYHEENFGGNHECDYCLARFGKDSAGRVRTAKKSLSPVTKGTNGTDGTTLHDLRDCGDKG